MSPGWSLRGLQFEITANLFVVMLAGLAIIAVVGASVFTQGVERSGFERLDSDARYLLQLQSGQQRRFLDLAAQLALFSNSSAYDWRLLDHRSQEIGFHTTLLDLPPDLHREIVQAVEAGREGRFGGVLAGGMARLDTITDADGRVAMLVGTLPRAEVRSRLGPALRLGLWVLLTAATVFVAFGAYLLRWRVVRPLQTLESATKAIASGRFDTRIPVQGADELAGLADSFNQMSDSLQREREALIEAQESLSRTQRLATVGQLAAGVAHEVGNPVSAVLSYSEVLLRDRELGDRSRDVAERIKKESLRVRVLVRDLLDLSRSEQTEFELVESRVFLSRVAERLRAQKLLEGIELVCDFASELQDVPTDPKCVEQILTNLIENAAHALEGREDPSIVLSARVGRMPARPARRREDNLDAEFQQRRQLDALVLEVRDNGSGISPDDLPHVFDPFFSTKDQGKGTGLGLWNVHRLAELLGGAVEVESRPGDTGFRLYLPLADNAWGSRPEA